MKDMFLAEELGYDPYEPYPPGENVLTEKDFKKSIINMNKINTRPNFEKARIEKHSITLSQLINNLSNNIFYVNLFDGFVETKENILLICKQYSMKVVCWDYVRMMAVIEPEEENCLNCEDAFWCATYQTYKKVLKCKHWSLFNDSSR